MFHLGINLLSAGLMLSLGTIIYLKNIRSLARGAFFITCASTATWLVTNGLLISTLIHDATLFRLTANLMYFSGLVISAGFLLFTWLFPKQDKPILPWQWVWLAAPLLIVLTSLFLTDGLIREVYPEKQVIDRLEFKFTGNLFFALVFLGNTVWSAAIFARKRRQCEGVQRLQITCVSLGFTISMLLGAIVMVILPMLGITQFVLLSIILPIPWIVITSYAIGESLSFEEKNLRSG